MDMTQASVNPDSHIEKQVAMPLLLENHFGRMPGFLKHMEKLYAASEALDREVSLRVKARTATTAA